MKPPSNPLNAALLRPPTVRRRTAGGARLIDHLPKPGPDGRTQLILTPLELIGRIAALVPPPRQHRHRYYGVLAPNSPRRPAITALAPHAVAPTPESKPAVETAADDPPQAIRRSPARYLWAMLLARLYQAFPLTCPHCGAEMRIIAFITESVVVRAILEHLGEPATPPRIALARGPPEWYEDAGSASTRGGRPGDAGRSAGAAGAGVRLRPASDRVAARRGAAGPVVAARA